MLFDDWLKNDKKIILFDGGMGTEIIKRGLEPGKIPDILNIENPSVISDIHKSYYEAGSDMCQTCTFGSSEINLSHYNLEERIKEINEKAAENARSVCPPNHLVVGDIGPNGEYRPPVGNISIEQMQTSFENQVKILDPKVDLWHVETITDLEEMLAAIRSIKKFSQKPIISSMTYKRTKRGFFTIMGDSLEKCFKALEQVDIDVIGANCTLGSADMIDLTKEAMNYTNKPLSIKPNAGKPVVKGGKTFYEQTDQDFTKDIGEIIKLGVKIVGGCCGTSPKTIKEIRNLIDSLN
ncbi:MAG: homocysteine S-methyltransferase family protein [archaeon]|nr:homocysteine S-methyltransferase family protein [archaeon]